MRNDERMGLHRGAWFGIALLCVLVAEMASPLRAASTDPVEPAAHTLGASPVTLRYPLDAPQLSAIQVRPVERVALPEAVPSNATVALDENRTSRVFAPISGRVIEVRAEIGQRVRAGDVLAVLDSPDLAAAQADLAKAQADLAQKTNALNRLSALAQTQTASQKDLESAQSDMAQSQAEQERAQQKVKNLHADAKGNGRFELRAPISGQVVAKVINPGLEANPGLTDPLYTISDTSRLWVLADVPEQSTHTIKPGQRIDVEVDAWPDERFQGIVELIGIAVDPVTRRVQVRCRVENHDAKLRPQSFARVAFASANHALAVKVPNTALVLDGVRTYVIVETQPGVFERRIVTIALNGAQESYVKQGLQAGERVVTEGALLLNSEFPKDAQ